MTTIAVSGLWTFVAALLAILLGTLFNRGWPALARSGIPPAVSGGLVIAVALWAVHATAGVAFAWPGEARALLLLVFFAGLGLSARFAGLAQGGIGVAILCGVIALTIVAQNTAGVLVAQAFGMPPALGLFVGSIPFIGGHGTAAAWAQADAVAHLPARFELGIAAATLGLVAGGLVGGPVAMALARRARAAPAAVAAEAAAAAPPPECDPGRALADVLSSDRWLLVLLMIAAALALGEGLQRALVGAGVRVPDFLTAISALLVFPLPGRDRDAAIVSGGYIGFALGAMPIGLGTMRRLADILGPAPRAFLIITLAASLFTDTANAVAIQVFRSLLG